MTQPPDDREHGTFGAPAEPPRPEPPRPESPRPAAPTQAWTPTPPPGPVVGWAAPVIPPQEVAPGLTWSDTGSRFVAYVLDTILVFIVSSLIVSALGIPTQASGSTDTRFSQIGTVIAAILTGAYFVLFWSGGRRATPGQRLFNIQIGNAFDGRPLTTTQAIKRWVGLGSFVGVLAIIPGSAAYGAVNLVLFVWQIVLLISTTSSATKQGLHDRFANSAVVRPAGAGKGAATTCLVIVLVLVALALISIIALIFLGGQVSAILSTVGESV